MNGKYTRLTRDELEKIIDKPDNAEQMLFGMEREILDAGQTWQELPIFLYGKPQKGSEDLKNAVLGGHPLGNHRFRWANGPPLYHTPDEVRQACDFFCDLSDEQLHRHLQPIRVWHSAKYSDILDSDNEELEVLLTHLQAIIVLYKEAGRKDEGIVFWID